MEQEEESRKEDEISHRNEYYLVSLLNDAFKGKGFQKINAMLQEKNMYPPQKYKKQLLNQLDKVLKKELDKNEFPNVSLLLKCIQMYCISDPQVGVNTLLQQGLIPKMLIWFERTRELLSLIETKESQFLVNLVGDFLDTFLIISRSNSEGGRQLQESFLPYLGQLVIESNINYDLRQEAISTLNTLLNYVPWKERRTCSVSEEMCLFTKELAKTILDVGDYAIQIAIVEALFRLLLKKWRDDHVHNWFEDPHIAKAFKEIKCRDFETDSRRFLNELNERLGDKRRVCSIPCKAAYAEINELNKPADDKLEQFWIDFNFGSKRISFYIESSESSLWEPVSLPKKDVSSCYLQEEGGEKILKMVMKDLTTINKKEATTIRIHFDSQFDIFIPLSIVMGKDKIMDKEDDHNSWDQPQCNPTSVSGQIERTEEFEDTESLSDILASPVSKQYKPTQKTSPLTGAMAASESLQNADEHAFQEASSDAAAPSLTCPADTMKAPLLNTIPVEIPPVNEKDKAIEPSIEGEPIIQNGEAAPLENDKLQKTNRAWSSSKQITETKKDAYEFETSSDPVAREMVSEMKQKVFVQKSILHRSSENKSERRLSTSYRNHLFSESNQEISSDSISEKSWILNSQKKPVPKSADYTRKRRRIRSILKVLPLSSPNSDGDLHAPRVEYSTLHREKEKRRMKPGKNMHNFTPVQPVGFSSTPLSHVRQNGLEMVDATLPFCSHSSSGYSDTETSRKHKATASTLPLKDSISKAKRKHPDLSPDFNRKCLKYSERGPSSEQSPSILLEPRKLFNSTELDDETPKGQHLDKSKDDVFVSKIIEEEIGESGIIAAFERFISEVKKMFSSRRKRIFTQNTLEGPERCLSALLNQVHRSRLNELGKFHDTVVHEIANLEKKMQFLSSLEKDTAEFWAEQSKKLKSKLNAFCIHQMQRIQSMNSVLDEPMRNLDSTDQNVKVQKGGNDKEQRS